MTGGTPRPAGNAGEGVCWAQLVPFQTQTSFSGLPAPPPYKTTSCKSASKPMRALNRADGELVAVIVAGVTFVQSEPFQSQVSPRELSEIPPNRTTWL